jgi:hypothetical protein
MGKILFFVILGFLIGLAHEIRRRRLKISVILASSLIEALTKIVDKKRDGGPDRDGWSHEFHRRMRH